MRSVEVRVPGKVILCGEHSVVYGGGALLVNVPLEILLSVSERNDNKVLIGGIEYSCDVVLKRAREARSAWKNGKRFEITDEMDGLMVVLGIVADTLESDLPGVNLEIESSIPVGAGLGSSAALGVGMVRALSELRERELSDVEIFELAMRVEEVFHGTPSGADVAACVWKRPVFFQKKLGQSMVKVDGELVVDDDVRRIVCLEALPDYFARDLILVDTGRPRETTGEMVEMVKRLGEVRDVFVERQGVLVDRLVRLVREDENAMRFRNLIEESERNLEKISVVSEWVVGLIHEIEGMGGVAKISGAGGRTKESGLLLVWHEDRDLVKKWAESNGLGILS